MKFSFKNKNKTKSSTSNQQHYHHMNVNLSLILLQGWRSTLLRPRHLFFFHPNPWVLLDQKLSVQSKRQSYDVSIFLASSNKTSSCYDDRHLLKTIPHFIKFLVEVPLGKILILNINTNVFHKTSRNILQSTYHLV